MSEINSIKFFRNHKSFSINKIANTFGINWRTAKKYADKDEIPREKKTLKKGMMYQEKWGEIELSPYNCVKTEIENEPCCSSFDRI